MILKRGEGLSCCHNLTLTPTHAQKINNKLHIYIHCTNKFGYLEDICQYPYLKTKIKGNVRDSTKKSQFFLKISFTFVFLTRQFSHIFWPFAAIVR